MGEQLGKKKKKSLKRFLSKSDEKKGGKEQWVSILVW